MLRYMKHTIITTPMLLCSLSVNGMGMDEKHSEKYMVNQTTQSATIIGEEKSSTTVLKSLENLHENIGPDTETLDAIQLSPNYQLHYAVNATNELETIEKLCSSHDPFKQDQYGRTALHYAAIYGRTDLLKYFLTSKTSINYILVDKNKTKTRLEFQQNVRKIIRSIVNTKDNSGFTATMYAFYCKKWDFVGFLMQTFGYEPIKQEIDELIEKTQKKPTPKATKTTQTLTANVQPIIIQNNYMITVTQPLPKRQSGNWFRHLFCSCRCGSGQSS